MTTDPTIRECEDEVAVLRRNIADAQNRREGLFRRIEGLRRAIGEIKDREDVPAFRLRMYELEAEIAAVERELDKSHPELESFREQLHDREKMCWELRRQRRASPTSPDDLRKAIDNPRYWRDGDQRLSDFIRDGFERMYPETSDN